jgi:hypothetical protein
MQYCRSCLTIFRSYNREITVIPSFIALAFEITAERGVWAERKFWTFLNDERLSSWWKVTQNKYHGSRLCPQLHPWTLYWRIRRTRQSFHPSFDKNQCRGGPPPELLTHPGAFCSAPAWEPSRKMNLHFLSTTITINVTTMHVFTVRKTRKWMKSACCSSQQTYCLTSLRKCFAA